MSRRTPRPRPQSETALEPLRKDCPHCSGPMWWAYDNRRTVLTLSGLVRLRLKIRRCANPACPLFRRPYRPETEGRFALPQSETGLDVIALVGALRHREHRSQTEIHRHLSEALALPLSLRSVGNLLERYDELTAASLADPERLGRLLSGQRRVILAIDGLQPHKGHEILWVVREHLSGEVLLATALLSATHDDLKGLLEQVKQTLEGLGPEPPQVAALISDGQTTIRTAIAEVFPNAAHQLCQFHFLREAARPIHEADRHAKKELKKQVRGVREIERAAEADAGEKGAVVRGYCAAVRAALDDEGKPPLDAPGLKLRERLQAISKSLAEAGQKGGLAQRARQDPRGDRSRPGAHRGAVA